MSGLRPIGAIKRRKKPYHDRERRAVLERSKGRCEGGCGRPGSDWCHLFGRGNQVPEPWCSRRELTAYLCRSCHRDIDEGRAPILRFHLQFNACLALAETFKEPWLQVQGTPLQIMATLIRSLTEKGAIE